MGKGFVFGLQFDFGNDEALIFPEKLIDLPGMTVVVDDAADFVDDRLVAEGE
jgi:hypothetical protein